MSANYLGTLNDPFIPKDVVEYVIGFMDQYEYADRVRIAIAGDSVYMDNYEEIKSRGCCGFVDYQKVPFKSGGKEFFFGFNYGH